LKKDIVNHFFSIEKRQRLILIFSNLGKFVAFAFVIIFVLLSLELFFYFPSWFKIFIVSLFSGLFLFFTFFFLKKNSSFFTANSALKRFFGSDISELFTNTFELIKSLKTGQYSTILTQRAIEERTFKIEDHISSSSFKHKNKNRKVRLLGYLFFMAIVSTLFISSTNYQGAINRFININENFSKPLKYDVYIKNKEFSVYRNENFKLEINVVGEELPSELLIRYNGVSEKLRKVSNSEFEYTFTNIRESLDFELFNSEYNSPKHKIKVIDKPKILNYTLQLNYPSYLGKQNEILENQNSILVPQGTQLLVKIITEGTDLVTDNFGKSINQSNGKNNLSLFSYIIEKQEDISYKASHSNVSLVDSLFISCAVIEDEYPQIKLDILQDSIYDHILYFKGEASDDYGIKSVALNVITTDIEGKVTETKTKLTIPLNLTHVVVDEIVNLENYFKNNPRKIELNIEVIDNDVKNHGKKSVSISKVIILKTEEEKQNEINNKNEQNLSSMTSMISETAKIEKELGNIKRSVQETNKKDWNTQKKIEALKKRIESLKQKMDALNKQLNQINNLEKLSDSQKEQKQLLEKELNTTLKSDLEKMMKAMEELMKQTDPNAIQQKIDEIKEQNNTLKENIDKSAEQYKNMEFEKRFEQSLDKLKELIDKQNALNNKEITPVNKDALAKEQAEISKEFSAFQKQMEELRALNNSLETPNKLENTDLQEQQIKQNLENSSSQMSNGKPKKAKASQSDAQKGMENLQDKLEKNKQQIEEENLAEDIDQVREILENLIRISVDQEKIALKFSGIKSYDPLLSELIKEQSSMKGNFEVIKDSLTAVSKRQPEVQAIVFKELSSIISNFDKISSAMFDKKLPEVMVYQRYVITSTNNLALFLAEALKSMKNKQSKMKSNSSCKKKGNNTCDNPGNSKKKKDSKAPNMEQIRKKQEGLNKKMPKPGQKPGQSMGGKTSEEIARMASEQEAIRRMLQQYLDNLKKEGLGYDGSLEKMIKQMELTEKEMVNKNINNNTIQRQQEILTRLLESEKAEEKREKEEQRESKEGQPLVSPTAKYLETLKNNKKGQKELLKKAPMPLKLYYKDKVSKYFINFGG